ncbi:hypothetical protein SODALDRAFT_57181 [Sodiomyces alkalinus F11]|uniref:Uncharacterized protein n=1 Tax=Sodiomyces alkalinus (strain CBS 110278 / VKM F-3762 / F11) TaxID=1314773 RepID=A0A3N2PNG1_SODAK|nr:hypothetical protein SODALDRAFT_57181 [Sodiomyces alkalinus F11]ROT36055.1 hypothetical protein SODALDRAFT_57181 [Sodiomyces alkalinus F11]
MSMDHPPINAASYLHASLLQKSPKKKTDLYSTNYDNRLTRCSKPLVTRQIFYQPSNNKVTYVLTS